MVNENSSIETGKLVSTWKKYLGTKLTSDFWLHIEISYFLTPMQQNYTLSWSNDTDNSKKSTSLLLLRNLERALAEWYNASKYKIQYIERAGKAWVFIKLTRFLSFNVSFLHKDTFFHWISALWRRQIKVSGGVSLFMGRNVMWSFKSVQGNRIPNLIHFLWE